MPLDFKKAGQPQLQIRKPDFTCLIIYSLEQKQMLGQLKKAVIQELGSEVNKWKVDFASDQGINKDILLNTGKRYDYVGIACSSVASLVCPPGISFYDAAGSLYESKFLILTDPAYIFSVPHGNFLLRRLLSKIFNRKLWIDFPAFTWNRLASHEEFEKFVSLANNESVFASVDIETLRKHLSISCIGMSLLLKSGQIVTGVLDCEDENYIERLRRMVGSRVPKTFQNGLYDNLYLLRWNAPAFNWVHDTSYYFHSTYSELPKDLGFLSAFYIRDFQFWKQEARGCQNKEDYHQYNAKDCWATLCVAIAQLNEAPGWVKKNFTISFPNVFPCLYMNAHGLSVDVEKMQLARNKAEREFESLAKELQVMTAVPEFNAGSPQQVVKLFSLFGVKTTSGEKELEQLATKHPLFERFARKIIDVREQKNAIAKYYNAELLNNRLMYNVHPCGTETGRFASQKSSFWCGSQIQNQPPYAKTYLQADPGWCLVEIDNEQSESRTTAYLSKCASLIATLESGKDFHSLNATKFFGADYEVARKKQDDGSDSVIRALAKRINHGVSYNMMALMFVYQCGSKMLEMARKELKLPIYYTHVQIADYLLSRFDKEYPEVRGEFQAAIKREISLTKKLVGVTGWTRQFFNDPSLTKRALNVAVAHGPQSLSVVILNEGLRRIWVELVLTKRLPIRLLAQIHDSIFFQVPMNRVEELVPQVELCMRNPTLVHGRTLIIPTATKICGQYWAKSK